MGPEVNRGEYRHKGGRLIAAEAAAAADGYARGALSAPEPARGRQRSAAPWGGGSRGSSKEPAKVNREDHRHEGGSECTQIHTKTQADVTVRVVFREPKNRSCVSLATKVDVPDCP